MSKSKQTQAADVNIDSVARTAQGIIESKYLSKFAIFKVNLLRGFAFGAGSFIGASLIVLVAIWLLNLLSYIPFLNGAVDTIKESINSQGNGLGR